MADEEEGGLVGCLISVNWFFSSKAIKNSLRMKWMWSVVTLPFFRSHPPSPFPVPPTTLSAGCAIFLRNPKKKWISGVYKLQVSITFPSPAGLIRIVSYPNLPYPTLPQPALLFLSGCSAVIYDDLNTLHAMHLWMVPEDDDDSCSTSLVRSGLLVN